MTSKLLEKFDKLIVGSLSCFDRLLIRGTADGVGFAGGMENYLTAHGVLLKDFIPWAKANSEEWEAFVAGLAQQNGLRIEYLPGKKFRKEQRIQAILKERGQQPGLVHIFATVERGTIYEVRRCNRRGRLAIRPRQGKCKHYYFYFVDPELGLGFARLSSWCPFEMQIYRNGHHWLEQQLGHWGIGCTRVDNAFLKIDDWQRAQEISDPLEVGKLHRAFDQIARRYCPLLSKLQWAYRWSVAQAEYSTDVVFGRREDLQPLYEEWVRTAVQAVRPAMVARFLGKRAAQMPEEVMNHFETRISGTRIRHFHGPVSIKMYDKLQMILRIETTINDVTTFCMYRWVNQRDGKRVWKWAEMSKSIYSLPFLRERAGNANRAYWDFLAGLDDPVEGAKKLDRLSQPAREHGRNYPGFNFFRNEHRELLETLAQADFLIDGCSNQDLRQRLHLTTGQASRMLKRLRVHGLTKKLAHRYRYKLTELGRQAAAAGLKVRAMIIIPTLQAAA